MNDSDRRVALKFIADYYASAEFDIFQIEKREFGIGLLKKIDARHLAFDSLDGFRKYLLTNTPLFVSQSTGYYEFPSATPIERKSWQGADLVFDLDMHSESKYEVYSKLDIVKQDAIRLVEEFLLPDFGISKKHILYNFSGNRGYHIHVRDKNFQDLGSDERKEIVDYIRGTGLNYNGFFDIKENGKIIGPRPNEQGHRGRFARAAIALLEKDSTKLSRVFSKDEVRNNFIIGISDGNWSRTSIKDIIARLRVVADSLTLTTVNTDAGVTQDLSKLIRVPNSVHGETGLIAKIVSNINSFDPLKDAITNLNKNKNELKNVIFSEEVPQLEFADSTFGPFKKDEKKELPISAAMFFVLKGSASFC